MLLIPIVIIQNNKLANQRTYDGFKNFNNVIILRNETYGNIYMNTFLNCDNNTLFIAEMQNNSFTDSNENELFGYIIYNNCVTDLNYSSILNGYITNNEIINVSGGKFTEGIRWSKLFNMGAVSFLNIDDCILESVRTDFNVPPLKLKNTIMNKLNFNDIVLDNDLINLLSADIQKTLWRENTLSYQYLKYVDTLRLTEQIIKL